MAKHQQLQSIRELSKYLSSDSLLPIYFLCGEDTFSIDNAVSAIEKVVNPLIKSDFDRELFSAEKSFDFSQALDFALAFPFGGGKKNVIIKNFDRISDKKLFSSYIKNPPEFTVLIVTYPSKLLDASKEPYSLLNARKYIFEAKPLNGEELVDWLVNLAKKRGLIINFDDAKTIIEIVGTDKSLLELQVQKYISYANGRNELETEELIKLSSPTKEYTIFDFTASLGVGNKARTIEIGLNLLEANVDIVYIISMVSKFIMTVAQILDLTRQRINDKEGAKLVGVSDYYYSNCKKASIFLDDERLLNASRALLNAEISLKTTSVDSKTILLVLISEILGSAIPNSFN